MSVWSNPLRPALSGAVAVVIAAAPALAVAAPADFHIRRKPLPEALLDFAVQADLSINTSEARRCRRLGNPVSGRMEPRDALRRILADTGCGFEMIDARTVRIVRLSPTAPHARPRPATPPPPEQPTRMDEVIVTATRRPSVASRLPYAVSAVSDERLMRESATSAGDIALLTSGLTVTNLGPGRDKLIIRGLSDGALTGRVQSTVGIYLDDARLTYNAPDPDLRLTDVRRVEILRGPQGSLYGAGSIGGVYHIVTRRPELEVREGMLAAEASITADGGPGYVLEAVVNQPIGEHAAVRLVGWDEMRGGYIDDPVLGLEDVNRTRRQGLRIAARWEPAPGWGLDAVLVGQSINSDDTQYADGSGDDLTRRNRVREPHHNDFVGGYLTASGTNGLGRLRWTTGWFEHELNSRYDASAALPRFGAPLGAAAPFDEAVRTATFVTELNLMSPIGARFPWLLGAFYAEGHEDLLARLTAPALLYAERRSDEVGEFSIYGEASASWRNWTLTGGGRLFWASSEVRSRIDMPGVGQATFAGVLEENGFAPKAVLRYQLTDRWMAYVQGAEGYRTGGFNTSGPVGQLFASGGQAPQPYRRYRGDELWSYEAGTKWTSPERRIAVQAAVFSVSWDDIQSTQILPSGLPFTANLGKGKTIGLELEGAWSLGPVDFNGALLVNEPELEEAHPGFPAAPDSELAGVPRFTASLSAHYQRGLGGGLMFETDARYAYLGESRLTFDASTAPAMGGYGILRLSAALRAEDWRVSAWVDNAADERGDTFAYGNPFTLHSTQQSTPQRPVSAGLRLEWGF